MASFPTANRLEVWDRLDLMNLALIQEGETQLDRAKKTRRMQKIFKRSQIGETILIGGATADEQPVVLSAQEGTVLAASRRGLTILTEENAEVVLDYRTIRLPLPRAQIEELA